MVKRNIEQNLRIKNFRGQKMEIMRETPRSRIREQSSVNKEVWDIVGSGKPTGSVPKETIAVSVTMSTSVKNDTVESVSELFHAAE